jgi:uncharacterized RDD family membrane protein YckC
MVHCPRCGERNPEDAVYCRNCSQALRGKETGFDKLRYDFNAQSLWLLRLIAYVVDTAIVAVVGLLLTLLAYVPLVVGSAFSGQWGWRGVWQIPFFIGAGQVIYFTVMESFYGASFGKQLMGLRVEAESGGRPTAASALVRNVSKVHGALLFFDVLLGLLLGDDPRDRFTDTLAKTYVARYGSPVIPSLRREHVFTGAPRSGPVVRMSDGGDRVDPLGSAGFGVFLIVMATIALNFPGLSAVLVEWIHSWGVSGVSWPPSELATPVYWFFMAMGSWSIIVAAIRYLMNWYAHKAPQDIVGGVFNLLLAYLVRFYGFSFFNWRVVVPLFIVMVGAQMLVGGLLRPRRD